MKVDSGTEILNSLLEGGFDSNIYINTLYGPAATGKTTCCFLMAIANAKRGGKTIFIDTENGFSVERLRQLTEDCNKILESIFLIHVNSFKEQTKKIEDACKLIEKTKIDVLIVDTIGAHYRNVLKDDVYAANKEMDYQLQLLNDTAKNHKTTVLITNQVYTNIENKKTTIVGGSMVIGWSKCLIELKKLHGNKRIAKLVKHKTLPEKEVLFEIVETGFTLL